MAAPSLEKTSLLVQQAVFTSARTAHRDGYQVVAASEGVSAGVVEELNRWGPAHDSLLLPHSREGSYNFQRLASGEFCISRTFAAGEEYSGRPGPRVYSSCLIAPPELLARFSNHPFRILEAATATGLLRVHSRVPSSLPAFRLRGSASPCLPPFLEPLCDPRKRRRVLLVMDAVLHNHWVIVSGTRLKQLFDDLLSLIPVECRPELSLSTGLKHSMQRQFRLMPAPAEGHESQRVARRSDAAVVMLNEDAPADDLRLEGWPQRVDQLLESSQISPLLDLLSRRHPGLKLSDLSKWQSAP